MSDCCTSQNPTQHLVIIGGGSAAFSAAIKANGLGAEVTLINAGLPIGGCCVNVGCVPSKTLIRAAEAHHRVNAHHFQGLEGSSRVSDFAAVMRQKTELVEELRQAKYLDVVADLPDFRRIDGWAKLIDSNTVEVNGESYEVEIALVKLLCPLDQRTQILQIAEHYKARVVDYGPDSLILQAYGSSEKLDAFIELLRPFGLAELVRSGTLLMARGKRIT